MSALTVGARIVADAALGASLGAMAFFSFVGAPRAFAVFGDDAGAYVNDVFPRYYAVNLALAAVGTVALGFLPVGDAASLLAVTGALVAAACHAVARLWLIPNMEAAGDDAFERYHGWSVGLNGVAMLAVAGALVAAHL